MAAMGVGTLIIFIAMVVIAAMAAGVMMFAGLGLRDRTQEVVDESTNFITKGIEIITIVGDRNENGNDSTIMTLRFPDRDSEKPLQGRLLSVSVSPDGEAPLRMELAWNSGVDLDTGLREERIYRVSSLTNDSIVNALSDINKVLGSCDLIATIPFDEDAVNPRNYVDYTVKDEDESLYYGYAVVGVDQAGNEILYKRTQLYNRTDNTTTDEDLTAPLHGELHAVNEQSGSRGCIHLDWGTGDADPEDTGKESPLARQFLYTSHSSLEDLVIYTGSDGKKKVTIPGDATLLEELNGSVSSFFHYPSQEGDYHYALIGEDAAGNQVQYKGEEPAVTIKWVDRKAPSGVFDLYHFLNPNSIRLRWSAAADGDSMIGGYNVYRSVRVEDLNTIYKIRHLEPIATLGANTHSYEDFNGTRSTRYSYLVCSVDNAGNIAYPMLPSDRFQMLEIKARTRLGSDPVNLNTITIIMNDGERDVILTLDNPRENRSFSADMMMGGDIREFNTKGVLKEGMVVNLKINLAEIGFTLSTEKNVILKFIYIEAVVGIQSFEVPSMLEGRYVTIW